MGALHYIHNLFSSQSSNHEILIKDSLLPLIELEIGEQISFGEMLQQDLNHEIFEVIAINHLVFAHEQLVEFTCINKQGNIIYLVPVKEEDEYFLMVSRKLEPSLCTQLFQPYEFEHLFDEGNEDKWLHTHNIPAYLAPWIVGQYRKTIDARPGYFYQGDFRNRHFPGGNNKYMHPISYTMCVDDSGGYVIDIVKFTNSGITDVYVTFYEAVSLIEK